VSGIHNESPLAACPVSGVSGHVRALSTNTRGSLKFLVFAARLDSSIRPNCIRHSFRWLQMALEARFAGRYNAAVNRNAQTYCPAEIRSGRCSSNGRFDFQGSG